MGSGVYSHFSAVQFQHEDEQRSQAVFDLLHVESLKSAIKDADTGQRGFILTGNEEYLVSYFKGLKVFEAQWTTLQADFSQDAFTFRKL